MSTESPIAAADFESALLRLERAVTALERGDLDLADALATYEQGVSLLSRCHALLDSAERQIALLTGLNEDGTPQTAPFDATATAALDDTPTPKPKRTRRAPASGDSSPSTGN